MLSLLLNLFPLSSITLTCSLTSLLSLPNLNAAIAHSPPPHPFLPSRFVVHRLKPFSNLTAPTTDFVFIGNCEGIVPLFVSFNRFRCCFVKLKLTLGCSDCIFNLWRYHPLFTKCDSQAFNHLSYY
ncbi:hypothetical protein RIF29_29823 [Crotalaria pallida]|uniref:Uncharacterized protein n=1 Tax=Crotalaria pallida TaxID=3830 RepID=A0AAN9EKE8_CROPI